MKKIAQLNQANRVKRSGFFLAALLVNIQVAEFLDKTEKFIEELFSWGADRPESSLKGIDGVHSVKASLLNVLLDKHNGRVGANSRENVVEQSAGNRFLVTVITSGGEHLISDILQILKVECNEILGDGGDCAGNIFRSAATLGTLKHNLADFAELLDDLLEMKKKIIN